MTKDEPEEKKHDGTTLGAFVLKMVNEGKTKTPEFLRVLEFFGREKLADELKKERERVKNEKPV